MNSTAPLPLEHLEISFAGVDPFLSLAVFAGVISLYMIYLMLRPLFEEGEISADDWARLEDDSMALLRRRDRVIAELKEIEFEAAMNKLDDHDLSQLRGQYEREALRLISELEVEKEAYATQMEDTQKKTSDLTQNEVSSTASSTVTQNSFEITTQESSKTSETPETLKEETISSEV